MGKKRVVKPTEEALLKERAKIEERTSKEESLKIKNKLAKARIYINSTYNNTIITLADQRGNVVYWTSAGRLGFKGTKKGTPFAATKIAEAISQVINKIGVSQVEVFVKGIGKGREAALRGLASRGVNIVMIKDVTPIPHNGPRPPKPRRV